MLIQGKVYIHNNTYLLVLGYRYVKKRRIYSVQKITVDGFVELKPFEVFYKKGTFKPVNFQIGVKAIKDVNDKLARQFRGSLRYTRKLMKDFIAKKDPNYNYSFYICREVIGMCGYYDVKTGKEANIRTIAKRLGFKNSRKLYRWLAAYYQQTCPPEKYYKIIPEMKDSTLINSFGQWQRMWHLLHGFSRTLDPWLERDFNGYKEEMIKRGFNV